MGYISLILSLFSVTTFGMEELLTKQSIHKIRYISDNGKITYYQKNSGELQMSTNYNFANLLKLSPNTQYLVAASEAQSKIALSANENFHNKLNFRQDHKIFVGNLGSTEPPKEIGKGIFPRLHLGDTWVSFFNNESFSYIFKSFNESVSDRVIKLKFNHSKYFTPQAYLLNLNNAVYTDINADGHYGIFLYSFVENKFELVYKAKNPGKRIQMCLQENTLIIGEFPILSNYGGSFIVSVNLYQGKFSKYKPIYSSNLPDIGNMICSKEEVYFVKTFKENKELNFRETEAVSVNLKTSKITKLSDLKFVTHIIKVNEKIIAPFRGKYYILKGNNDLTKDQIIERKEK